MGAVIVFWKDAFSVDEWSDYQEIEPSFQVIESCGFVVKESDEVLTLGLNHDITEGSWSCIMHIPKGMIISIHELNAINRPVLKGLVPQFAVQS